MMSPSRSSSALTRAAAVVVEALERRQLLASVAINFQPSGTSTPSGFLADSGASYANRGNGYSYGWNTDNTANVVNDGAIIMIDTAHKTHAKMQPGGVNRSWEIGLANGAYQVRVVAGDYQNAASVYDVRVEGQQGPSGTADPYTHWFEKTVIANVSDGKLTITNGSNASDQRIAFIQITDVASLSVPSPTASNLVARAASNNAVDLVWDDTTSNEYGFEIQRKLGSGSFATIATVGGGNEYYNFSGRAFYNDSGLTSGAVYTYRVRPVNAAGAATMWSNEATVDLPATNAQAAYNNGVPRPVTSNVEAEDFDTGGPGFGYLDNSTGNYADLYRRADVDVGTYSGGYFVGWNSANEWTAYTVSVPVSGIYDLTFARSRSSDGGTFQILQDGERVGPESIEFQGTGSAFTFANTTVSGFNLTAGTHVLTLKILTTPSGSGEAGNIDWFRFDLVSEGVAKPTNLAAPTVESNSVQLTWTDAASNETSYTVQRKVGSGSWSNLATGLPANTTSYTDATVSPNTTYSYQVIAVSSTLGPSPASSAVTVTTPANTNQHTLNPTADAYVRGGDYASQNFGSASEVLAKLITSSNKTNHREIFFKFDTSQQSAAVMSAVLRVYGRRHTLVSADPNPLNFEVRSVSDTNWTESGITYTNSRTLVGNVLATIGLTSTTNQWYEIDVTSYVQAQRAAGNNLISLAVVGTYAGSDAAFYIFSKENANKPELVVQTQVASNPPAAPSSLALDGLVMPTGPSVARISLRWTDNATNEASYHVERKLSSGTQWQPISGTLSAGTTMFADTNAATDETYDYRVYAVNTDGSSGYATLSSISTPPSAPSDLAGVAGVTSIDLAWNDLAETETAYRVEYRRTNDPTDPSYHSVVSAQDLGADASSYTLQWLLEGTQYDLRVRAINSVNDGWPTGPIQPWTKLATPTNVTLTNLSSTSMRVAWTDNSTKETSYVVEYSTDSSFATGVVTKTEPTNSTFSDLPGLTVGATYFVRLRAVNANTQSEYWSGSNNPSGQLSITRNPVGSPNEGSTVTLNAVYANGAPQGTTYTWAVTRGGQSLPGGTGSSLVFTATDNGVYEVSLNASNGDVATHSFTVVNVNPTATISGVPSGSVNEGSQINLTVAASDAGTADTFTYAWTVTKDGQAYSLPSGTVTNAANFLFVPRDNGSFIATVVVTDDDGGSVTVATAPITANNVAPVAGIIDTPVGDPDEGDTVYATATVTDDGEDDTHTYAWSVTKDGQPYDLTGLTTNAATFAFVPNDNGDYVIELSVSDDDEAADSTTSGTITVHNLSPIVSITGNTYATQNTAVALTSALLDRGSADTHLYVWSLTLDGQPVDLTGSTVDEQGFTFAPTTLGNYVATLTVTDDDGGEGIATREFIVTDEDPPPGSPSSLVVTSGGVASMQLNWQASTGDVDGYVIQRSVDGGTWVELDVVYGDTLDYQDHAFVMSASLKYRVYGFNTFGHSAYSNDASFTTGTGGLSTPGAVAASAGGTSSAVITWSDTSAAESGFLIEVDSGGGFAELARTLAGTTTYVATGLADGTTYTFRVLAINSFGASGASAASVTTAVLPPENLRPVSNLGGSLYVSWSSQTTRQTPEFEVSYRADQGNWSSPERVSEIVWHSPATVTQQLGVNYSYRVRSVTDNAQSEWVETSQVTESDGLSYLQALDLTLYSSPHVSIRWPAVPSGNLLIERSVDGSTFAGVATVAASDGEWSDLSVNEGKALQYRARFDSVSDAEQWQYTRPFVSRLVMPVVTVSSSTSTSAVLTWTDNSTAETNYVVLKSTDGGEAIMIGSTTDNDFSVTDLSPGSSYSFSVYAANAVSVSDAASVTKPSGGSLLTWFGGKAGTPLRELFPANDDPMSPPTLSIWGLPAVNYVGAIVNVGVSSNLYGSREHYVWEIACDSEPYLTAGGKSFRFTADVAGTYIATVRAYRGLELVTSTSKTFVVAAGNSPTPNTVPTPVNLILDSSGDGRLDRDTSASGTDESVEADQPALVPYAEDINLNEVPDFAEGLGGSTPASPPALGGAPQLVPLNFGVQRPYSYYSSFENESLRVRFDYSGSDPTALIRAGAGTTYDPYTYSLPTESGPIRVWAVPSASVHYATVGTFYVQPGEEYSLANFEGMDLYVQAVSSFAGESIGVTIKQSSFLGGFETSDQVLVISDALLDVDVDSDNTATLASPADRTSSEDDIEYVGHRPGKILLVNDGDNDQDGIPNFADGFGSDPLQTLDDSSTGFLTPVSIRIPAGIDPTQDVLTLLYDASDPHPQKSPLNESYYAPAFGSLRLWSADESSVRNWRSMRVNAGGSFVEPGQYVGAALQRLLGLRDPTTGTITLYAEGVRTAQSSAITVQVDNPITLNSFFQIGGQGLGSRQYFDAVRVSVIQAVAPRVRGNDPHDTVVSYETRDFDLPGWTDNLGLGRVFSNAPELTIATRKSGISTVSEWPQLINAGMSVYALVRGHAHFFDRVGAAWKPRFEPTLKLSQSSDGFFHLVTDSGDTWTFRGFDPSQAIALRGQFESFVSAGGKTVSVGSRTTDGDIKTVVGGTTTLNYEYESAGESKGELREVSALRDGVELYRADFTYYPSSSAWGGPHDINTVAVWKRNEASGGEMEQIESKRYWYYKHDPHGSHRSRLFFAIEGDDYQRAVQAGMNVATITNPTELRIGGFVTFVSNGRQNYLSSLGWSLRDSYVNPTYSTGPNAWVRKVVSLRIVNLQNLASDLQTTVYYNAAGQPLLIRDWDLKSRDQQLTAYRYDAASRLIAELSPAAVTGYDERLPSLIDNGSGANAAHVSDSAGLVTHYRYNSDGLLDEVSISQGELGTKTELSAFEYDRFGADQIWRETKAVDFATESGIETQARVTQTGFPSIVHNLPTKIVTTRPDLMQTTAEYNVFGRLERFTDADGYTSTTVWDNAIGVPTAIIRDDGASQESLRLQTAIAPDAFGRPTSVLDPAGRETEYRYEETPEIVRTIVTLPDGRVQETSEYLRLQFRQTLTKTIDDEVETIVAAEREYLDVAGRTLHHDRYFNIPPGDASQLTWGTQSDNSSTGHYHRTSYVYDASGRLTNTIDGVATNRGVKYDGFGRVVEETVNGAKVRSYQYLDDPANGTSYTITTAHPDGTGKNDRYMTDYFDWRGRHTATENGVQLVWRTYNNLDEQKIEEVFENTKNRVDGVVSGVQIRADAHLGRVAQTSTDYNPLGLPSRVEQHLVAANGMPSAGLVTKTEYDGRGHVKRVTQPGGLVTATFHDGAGRPFYTKVGSASVPLQEQYVSYDDADNAILTRTVQRKPDGSSVVYSSAAWYDAQDRVTTTANYGETSLAFSRPTSVPEHSDATVLVNKIDYDDATYLISSTDPRSTQTDTFTDALGRPESVVENAEASASSVERRWTRYEAYDGLDRPLIMEVKNNTPSSPVSGGEWQTTRYQYQGPAGELSRIEYPGYSAADPTPGSEQFFYSNLGELRVKRDRSGVTHTYERDHLGRVTKDIAGFTGAVIDGRVRSLTYGYDVLSRPTRFSSHAPGGGTVNEVTREYNSFAQLTREWQEHDGAVTASSQHVDYGYQPATSGSRLASVTYPGGKQVTYGYAGDWGNAGIVTSVSDASGVIETYGYLGLAQVITKTRPGDIADMNVSLDPFGRTHEVTWANGGIAADRFTYEYDFNGNTTSETNHTPAGGPWARTFTYSSLDQRQSDSRGRITSVFGASGPTDATTSQQFSATGWDLDSQGNRYDIGTSYFRYGQGYDANNGTTDGTHGPSGTLHTIKLSAGSDSTASLKFDAWNRMVRADFVPNGTYSGKSYTIEYDALGRRIETQIRENTLPAGPKLHDFYDGSNLVEQRYRGSTLDNSYVTNVWSADGALALRDRDTDDNGTFDERLWLQHDAKGSTTSLADVNGAVVERLVYDADGRPVALTSGYGGYNRTLTALPNPAIFGGDHRSSRFAFEHLYEGVRWLPIFYNDSAANTTNAGLYEQANGAWLNGVTGRTIAPDPAAASIGRNAYAHGDTYQQLAAAGHLALDVVGVFEPWGIADGLNAAWYTAEGDYRNAAISTAGAALPLVGDLAKFTRVGKHLVNRAVKYGNAISYTSGLSRPGVSRGLSAGLHFTHGTAAGAAGGFVVGGIDGYYSGQGVLAGGLDGAAWGALQGGVGGAFRGAANPYICFVAGTQVVVAIEEDGNARGGASAEHAEGSTAAATRVRYKTVAIETLVARGGGEMGDGGGQVVLTRDQHDPTGPLVRRRITRTYQRTAYALQVLTLRDEDGNEQTLRVTEEHPFYVDAAGWTPAKSLEAADMLLGADGTLTVVANEHEAHPNGVTVYNLEVEQAHTYFVLAQDAHLAVAAWVHNATDYEKYVDRAKLSPALKESAYSEASVAERSAKWAKIFGEDSYANAAHTLGYRQVRPTFNVHGQKVFFNGRTYISPDVDSHIGGIWKMFDRKGNRIGTFNGELEKIGK